MKKLKLGIVGIGHLGRYHLTNCLESSLIEFIGFFDVDREKSKKIASEYRITSFDSLSDLLRGVDAISVVVPTSAHYEVAKRGLDAGKHIFIEKPITVTLSDAEELIRLSESNGLKIQVGHIERFNPAFTSLNGFNLNPGFIESHRLAVFNPRGTDVSVVLDLMIHDIDIILSIIKSPVEEISASGVNVISDSTDIANARIQFKNGAVANITVSRISQKNMRKMRIFQKNNYITVDFLNKKCEIFSLCDEDEKINGNNAVLINEYEFKGKKKRIFLQNPTVSSYDALRKELESFAESVLYNKDVKVSAVEGKMALEVALNILDIIENRD